MRFTTAHDGRRLGLAAVAGLLLAAPVAAAVGGGLQVKPLRIEAQPHPGVVGRIEIGNPSSTAMKVTVRPRRWRQSRDGRLSPDLRGGRDAGALRVNATSFTLPAKGRRLVEVALRRLPGEGYLYAAVVARGVAAKRRAGLEPAYQIATAVHIAPAASRRRFRIAVAPPRARKRRGGGFVFAVAVRNLGNMVEPVGGTAVVRGPGGTRTVRIKPAPILPGGTVRLSSVVLRGLRPGRYRATARVAQQGGSGRGRGSSSHRFTVLRGGRIAG